MRYILLNPSFKKEPIEIDNPEAIKRIEEYRKIKETHLGNIIPIVVNGILFNLGVKVISKDFIKFELI